MAGAMSTAEIGKIFSEIIRRSSYYFLYWSKSRRYYELSSTFSLRKVPNYRDLTPQDEWDLLEED
jgi:deoxyhypusine synthase